MKICGTLLLFLILMTSSYAQDGGEIIVKVSGVASEQGQLRVALFDSPDGFPDQIEQSMKRSSVEVNGDSSTIIFSDIPFGEYVIAVFHDENDNGVLDTNDRGIPLEALGVSGDAAMKLGPPKYERAAFQFSINQTEIEIPLKQFKAADK